MMPFRATMLWLACTWFACGQRSGEAMANAPESLDVPELSEVCCMALAEAGMNPNMARIGGAAIRRLLHALGDRCVY